MMTKIWRLLGELALGLLVAGILAPYTLLVLPDWAQGPAALGVVGTGSVALVMGAFWYGRRGKRRDRHPHTAR